MFVGGPAHERDIATGGVACYLIPVPLPLQLHPITDPTDTRPAYEVAEYDREMLWWGKQRRFQEVYRFKRYRSTW